MVFEWGLVLFSAVSTVVSAPLFYLINKMKYTRPEHIELYAVDINDIYKIEYNLSTDKNYIVKSTIEVDKIVNEVLFVVNGNSHSSFEKEFYMENTSILYKIIGGNLYVYSSGFTIIQSKIFDASKML